MVKQKETITRDYDEFGVLRREKIETEFYKDNHKEEFKTFPFNTEVQKCRDSE